MNRLHYALSTIAALAGIGSAFTINKFQPKSYGPVLHWYLPKDLATTYFTGTHGTAEELCPIEDPTVICLLGYTMALSVSSQQTPADQVTGQMD